MEKMERSLVETLIDYNLWRTGSFRTVYSLQRENIVFYSSTLTFIVLSLNKEWG